jgi:murein DD-endopeptidase MepM/ murein hydrolase activator NlpD
MKFIAPLRERDSFGCGHFGASRGSRIHNGVDHACVPGSQIFSPVEGEVTKLGYPYGNDLSFRYVQITTQEGYNVRVFYVKPFVSLGDFVTDNDIIGSSQKLGGRYPEITEHIHLEIKDLQENYIDPKDLGL